MDDRNHPAPASPLIAWCFIGTNDLWALTGDETGSNLPTEHGPWRLLKSIALTAGEADEEEAEALIRQYGYCCFENRDSE